MKESLQTIVDALNAHEGPWGEWKVGEKTETGAIQMPYIVEAPVLTKTRKFLNEDDLTVTFDWPNWQEGREFFTSEDPKKFDTLDQETTLKLLSAVMRNARFNEGAWVELFESGDGQKLFERLLELQS